MQAMYQAKINEANKRLASQKQVCVVVMVLVVMKR